MTQRVLNTEDIDQLGQAVISLTKELWALKDRQRILEAALADAGVLGKDIVDTYEPDAALAATLSAERRQLIDSVLNTLSTPSLKTPHR
jgi:hypothetical protein